MTSVADTTSASQGARKQRAAWLSIVSNSTLIALKIAAGVITGSVAIITEAVHSSIDLVASIVAFFSVRKAHEPADDSHPYGHEKVENLAAQFEGVLIVLGAAVIIYEAVQKLGGEPSVEKLGFGIAVIGLSMVVNYFVSGYLYRQADATDSPALAGDAAHLRTDAITSMGVLVALALVAITGVDELDAIAALVVAVAIVFSGVRLVSRSSRVLVDEVLPEAEMAAVREAIQGFGAPELIGFHKVRARRGGSLRYVDLHVQFRRGTSLERAHDVSHQLQSAIRDRLGGADVLIHLEPEDAADASAGDARRSGLSAG
jgi:cation diffusion facilitator family transporter